jgi:CAAX protease family protein
MNDGVIGDGTVAGGLDPVPAPGEETAVQADSEAENASLGDEVGIAQKLDPMPDPILDPMLEPVLDPMLEPVPGSSANNGAGTDYHLIVPPLATGGFPYLERERPAPRTPNFADACLFLVLMLLGLLITTGTLGLGLHYHWLGLRSFDEASRSTPIALGTQLLIYLIALTGAVPFFRMVWGKGYFEGLHWHAATASRLRYRLITTAFLCNVLAVVGNWLLPFPQHAPIDKLFGSSRDAWMLSCFGVTIAPFFEEMIFRGFLLPAVATAWDWLGERATGRRPRQLDFEGNPQWSFGAMIFAALVVSAPFALMHSAQVGQAWGPLLLLYCISLILCAVRLGTRSLAASTLVHSGYNCMLFTVMLVETGGFGHMDKL